MLFGKTLLNDTYALIRVINKCGVWDAAEDAKLNALEKLRVKKYRGQKVLVFTQFADTANYNSALTSPPTFRTPGRASLVN
jgi:hypothetical protein